MKKRPYQSHWSCADCSLAVFGSTAFSVVNSATPHGLTPFPIVPARIRGHSSFTTYRP